MRRPAAAYDSAALVSDIHLSADDPATAAQFFAWIDAVAAPVQALIVLGDLFDVWVGDDDCDAPVARRACERLAAAAERGTAIWLMRGNRDLLLDVPLPGGADPAEGLDGEGHSGERHRGAGRSGGAGSGPASATGAFASFSARCGARLLDDPALLAIGGDTIVLTHGDALCTDDSDYQRWRAHARSAAFQREFLGKPLAVRQQIGAELRARSESAKRGKPLEIMDVNAGAIEALMRGQRVTRLIHGHTHRPATHRMRVDGADCERWVLPDWSAAGGRGGGLLIDAGRWVRLDARGRVEPVSPPSG